MRVSIWVNLAQERMTKMTTLSSLYYVCLNVCRFEMSSCESVGFIRINSFLTAIMSRVASGALRGWQQGLIHSRTW